MPSTIEKKSERVAAAGRFDPAAVARYRRAVDYLAAAEVYLQANALLRAAARRARQASPARPLGDLAGNQPVYAHLESLDRGARPGGALVTGPGHGAAANLANLYLDGSLAEVYPEMTRNAAGLERFVKAFSWPGGIPSHLRPERRA